ncbi:alpha/beta hydrolase [Legionella anisa]|uniref:Alpha/beta hydrolase n=1 Tax=Legionella anisa TaxID=28082 RepID=A0AAX0WYU5_9GAMM|nr:alpha/beta hydrolase [Legionella anisa]AWN72935.1 alpha/beta hydrolase [Legionella anisa]KTC70611.1 lipolytic protein [Legionella anisa]MBN5937206.1 alpha/beta hydrolase [Legionella anisa]MCW8423746.1 alpha/beta hydrolase [Legionella anisa]MCW8447266.1 alpha/beta hydrolase [Legionella anisa]
MLTFFRNLSVWEENRGMPCSLLFLHGHCTNKNFFNKQMNADILKSYHRIAIDLPGYGESAPPIDPLKTYSFPGFAEAITEAVHQLPIKKLIIVGWSLGGHVALEMISKLPQLIGLLITGTPPFEVSLQGIQKGFKVLDPEIMACFGKKEISIEEAKLLAKVSGYDGSEEKKFLVDAILATDEGARFLYPQSIINGIGQNQCDIIAEWEKPIAVVAGENDIAINYDYVQSELHFKNLWQNKVHIISNAGHAVMLDQPDAFNLLIKEFTEDTIKDFLPNTIVSLQY